MPQGVAKWHDQDSYLEWREQQRENPRSWHNAASSELAALDRAMRLSGGDLNVCEALLRGEDVPASRLDPYWVQRLGVRRAA